MEDPYLKGLFLSAYAKYPFHLDNVDAMFSNDLLNMLLLLFDNRFTGEHNGSVKQAKNPKYKPDPSKFRETDSILAEIAQGFPRWERVFSVKKSIIRQSQESDEEEAIVLQIIAAGRKNIKQD